MGNTQYSSATVTQQIANEISSYAVNVVGAECNNINEYTNIIIDNSIVNGSIKFDQACEITGEQILGNALDIQIDNLVTSLQQQKQTTDAFFIQTSVNQNVAIQAAKQELKNNVVQTAINSCQQDINNIIRNATVVVRNSSVLNGDITFIQQGTISTTCVLNNIAKILAANKLKSEQDQIQSTTVGFGNILIIVLAVVAVVIIGVVLYFVFTNKSNTPPVNSVRVVDTRVPPPPSK